MAGSKGSRVRDVDRGLDGLLRRAGFKGRVKVGVFGDAAGRRALELDGEPGSVTVGDVAAIHEFGQHARPWLRPAIAENLARLQKGIEKAAAAILAGKLTEDQALDQIGLFVVGLVKQRIISGIPPELTREYLRRKLKVYPGATTPLIASTQFLGSIAHEKTKGSEE